MNLNINTEGIKLTINEDPSRVISFNPNDLGFAERFYDLISEFETKSDEYQEKAKQLENDTELDQYGIVKNLKPRLALMQEICMFLRNKVDEIFGTGTSNTVFGGINTLDMFAEFFNGITPYIQKARMDKLAKYTGKTERKKAPLR
jgi:hypothetical protein